VDGKTYYVLDASASTGQGVNISSSPEAVLTATLGTQPASVVTSTALENGTVYHIVQSNEALWSIALAYDLTVEELKRLNQLSSNDIFIGQKLLIRKIDLSTSTLEPTITVTLGIPTSTATRPVTPTDTFTPTSLPTPPASRTGGGMVVGGIVAVALVAAALGAWLGRQRTG
jgi:LysM repeat protein